MRDCSEPVRLSRPQTDMLAHVEALLRRHPRLVPAWDTGWTLELACDDHAIWATATASDPTRSALARMETPRWWLPERSGRALAIAEGLATDLQREIALGD